MSKIVNEQLSAFLDDELETVELELVAKRLASDPDLRAKAVSYSLIGDVLRDELSCQDPVAFGRQVAARTHDDAGMPPTGVLTAPWRRWGRSLAGAGVAAAVAVVAVLALQESEPVDHNPPALTVPVADRDPGAPAYTVPAAYSRRAGTPDRLSRYYLNHSEYALLLGGQGSLVRMVSGPPPEQELDQELPSEGSTPTDVTTER